MTLSAAFFDLDRTLLSGSSAYYLSKVSYHEGLLPFRRLLADGASGLAFRLIGASDQKTEALRDRMLAGVAGQPADTIRDLSPTVTTELIRRVRNEARTLLDLHVEAARDVYLVSASPVEIVDELARALGLAGGLGTRSEIVDGCYTGRLAAPFCYGEGKAEVVRRLAGERGYDLGLCYAYADSSSDLPILELVGHPVAVNPDRGLLTLARERGWPVVEFNRQAKHRVRVSAMAGLSVAVGASGYVTGRRHGHQRDQAQRRPGDGGAASRRGGWVTKWQLAQR